MTGTLYLKMRRLNIQFFAGAQIDKMIVGCNMTIEPGGDHPTIVVSVAAFFVWLCVNVWWCSHDAH